MCVCDPLEDGATVSKAAASSFIHSLAARCEKLELPTWKFCFFPFRLWGRMADALFGS